MIRRINLYAGPCAGKSTIAAHVFSHFRAKQVNIELVTEYVKSWAYEERKITSYDQLYLLAKQLRQEDLILRNGVDLIVTDSPILLSACYAQKYGFPSVSALREIAAEFEKTYPSLNIFIERGRTPYNQSGRYETYEQAVEMDAAIEKTIFAAGVKELFSVSLDTEIIIKLIETKLETF